MMNFFWSYQQLQQLYTSIKYGYLYNWWAATNPATIEYGYLYNWYAATDSRNICSVGWSLPSNAQFDTLIAFIGANPGYAITEANLSYWTDIIGCTNSSGFNGRGAGNRAYTTGAFTGLRNLSAFWTTTVIYAGYGCTYGLYNSNHSLFQLYNAARRADGCSIRLIKDSTTLTNGQTGTYTGNDGRVYQTICIGTQEWLSENLMETKYRNGDAIPEVTDNTAWAALTTGARCSYNNTLSNAGTGNAITSSNDWVVPTTVQRDVLFNYIGGVSTVGGKLKETGLTYWNSPNTGATNEFGFNGRGSGYRTSSGFTSLGNTMQIMCSNQNSETQMNGWQLIFNSNNWSNRSDYKYTGWAIRLLYVGTGTPTNYIGNDGKTYRIIQIGTQYWLADNLAETKYRDGSTIPVVTDSTAWAALTTGARCVYNNDDSNM